VRGSTAFGTDFDSFVSGFGSRGAGTVAVPVVAGVPTAVSGWRPVVAGVAGFGDAGVLVVVLGAGDWVGVAG
jgi:hypothetical protein